MDPIAKICLILITLIHGTGLIFFMVVLRQMRRSAEAVEVLAYRTQEQVERVSEATDKVRDVAGTFSSAWMQAAAVAISTILAAWPQFKKRTD
jgi:hypothetical protein